MKEDFDIMQLLNVFEKIRTHGEERELGFYLEGITGYTDHDGYNVFLEGHQVKLNAGFHNTYHLDYDSSRAYEQFVKKLKYIDKNYS